MGCPICFEVIVVPIADSEEQQWLWKAKDYLLFQHEIILSGNFHKLFKNLHVPQQSKWFNSVLFKMLSLTTQIVINGSLN